MNLFFVVAAWVALLAVAAEDERGLRGGQHRALEVHNEQPDAAEYDYFEGSEEEEEFLSLEERDEMGLDAEDRDLAYNGYGNGSGRFHSGGVRGGYGGRGD